MQKYIKTKEVYMEYEIWMEGFAVTGQSSDAQYIGKAKGETFEEACKNYVDEDGEKLKLDEHRDYPAIWACRLYDNEKDARKSFG